MTRIDLFACTHQNPATRLHVDVHRELPATACQGLQMPPIRHVVSQTKAPVLQEVRMAQTVYDELPEGVKSRRDPYAGLDIPEFSSR